MQPIQPKYTDNTCAICREDYLPVNNQCLLLKCGHIFHKACLEPSLDYSTQSCRNCPLCGARFSYRPIKTAIEYASMVILYYGVISYMMHQALQALQCGYNGTMKEPKGFRENYFFGVFLIIGFSVLVYLVKLAKDAKNECRYPTAQEVIYNPQ